MGSTKIILSDQKKELYIRTLKTAQGQRSLNEFARNAGLSPGNLSRIMKGQVATPETLARIAKTSPKTTYQELMVAAGYIEEKGQKLACPSSEAEKERVIAIPLMKHNHSHNSINKKQGENCCFIRRRYLAKAIYSFLKSMTMRWHHI